jgi:hypothetical protein
MCKALGKAAALPPQSKKNRRQALETDGDISRRQILLLQKPSRFFRFFG